jgi:histidyl-tRNA synthetase
MATLQDLDAAIAEQSALFNQLKAKTGPTVAAELEAARVRLGDLKKSRGALLQAAGAGGKDKRRERLLLKTAKVRQPPHHRVPTGA